MPQEDDLRRRPERASELSRFARAKSAGAIIASFALVAALSLDVWWSLVLAETVERLLGWSWLTNELYEFPHSKLPIMIFASICIPGAYCLGLALARLCLHVWPPHIDGRSRPILCVAICLTATIWFSTLAATTYRIARREFDWHLEVGLLLLDVGIIVGLQLGLFLPTITRYLRPRSFINRPFALFLRRFSTFADQAVLVTALRSSPPGVPIAYLTPTRSRPVDWSPFRILFSGLRLRRPVRNLPITVRASDDTWEEDARELIECAEAIIIDASDDSDAIRREIGILSNLDHIPRIVVVSEHGMTSGAGSTEIAALINLGATVVQYRRSWIQALPRMVIGAVITPLAMVAATYVAYWWCIESMPSTSHIDALATLHDWWLLTVTIVVATAGLTAFYYWRFLAVPALGRAAKRQITSALRR